jgi:tryptophanyl-tRNA synthetase
MQSQDGGRRVESDVSYQYLSYFLEDDGLLEKIHDSYGSGEMSAAELKDLAISELWKFMQIFQERRERITEEEVSIFMDGTRSLRLAERYKWKT